VGRLTALLREGRSAGEFITIYRDLGAGVDAPADGSLQLEEMGGAHLADIAGLNRSRGEPGADRYFAESLRDGIQGFAAYDGGQLIGYAQWVAGEHQHPDFWAMGPFFRLRPGDAYLAGFYLLPERRGKGAGSDFLAKFEAAMRAKGYGRICAFVEADNLPARRLYDKHGWFPTWSVHYVRVVVLRRRRLAPPPPLRPGNV
jgi:GNAT superfamily N-acetyltransferase